MRTGTVPAAVTLRRLAFPLWLARVRLTRRGGRLVLVVAGLAAAAAMLAAVLAGSVAAEDRSVGRAVSALSPDVRAVRVNWFSVGGQVAPYATLDAHVRRELQHVAPVRPFGTSLYRESTLGGAFLGLGAVDDLGRWVRLRSGRLPRTCSPSRCEVLVIRRGGRIPNVPGLRLVAVGEGDLRSGTLFGDAVPVAGQLQSDFVQAMVRYHRPAPPPLVLANGVAALDRQPRLHDAYRSYGWVLPLDRGLVRAWAVRDLAARIETVRTELQAEPFGFALRAPTDELRAAADSSRVAGRRLFLLGGEAVALLLAFTVLVAMRLRRDVDASRERLGSSGVRRWQVEGEVVTESATMAVAGTLLGWLVGVGVAVALAGRSGEPVGALVRHSLASGGGIAAVLLLAVGATLVLVTALAVRPLSIGKVSFSPLDAAALGAAAVVAVALARGAADAQALLAGGGTGVVLLLLPALVGFAAAVAVARVVPPGLRLLERVAPRGALSFRLAALALARRPGQVVVAVGFVAVAIGLALFAETYRWTLVRGEHDQAAFAVPADYVVKEDLSQLIPVDAAVTPAVLSSLPRALRVEPVTRQNGSIQGAADVSGIAVLGLSAKALPRIDGWRSDFASASLPELAHRIDAGPKPLRGAALPLAATRLALPIRVLGTEIGVVATIRARDGSFVPVRLGGTLDSRPVVLRGTIPARARGGKLVAFRFEPPPKLEERGADAGAPATGTVALGPLAAITPTGTVKVTDYGDWIGTTGVGSLVRRGGVRFGLTLTNEVDTYLRPRQPTDGLRIPAVVSPRMAELAGRDGLLGIDVAGQSLIFRVAGVARRFPGTASLETADFVVADRPALVTALNASSPGTGFTTELWLSGPRAARAAAATRLAAPPFTVLDVASQAGLERQLRTDPVARAAVAMLEAAAVTALVLALLGLLLGVVAERSDDRAELFDLEAQGLAPAQLRRQLRLRALVAAASGAHRRRPHRARALRARRRFRRADRERDRPGAPARALPGLGGRRNRCGCGDRRRDPARRRRDRSCVPAGDARPLRGGRSMSTAIEARDVFRVHSTPEGDAAALQGLTLSVADGEILTVLGPSGSGKTTLLRILAGLDLPSAGSVRVLGHDVRTLGARGRSRYRAGAVGYLDQHYARALAPELTAQELVSLKLRAEGVERKEREARARGLLERVGLGARAAAYPGQLSGGEQQRVALGAAIAHRPRLLLADEPTGELDEASARLVYDAIAELAAAEGCTVVIVSHDPASTAIADRFVHIRDGRVSEETVRGQSGESSIVVGRGGWLRLPQEYLDRAGIGARAAARLEGDRIVVVAAGERERAEEAEPAPAPVEAGRIVARLEGVDKAYGSEPVFADLEASFEAARVTAVTGPSGSGKTTLLHLLAGLELPDAGQIEVCGSVVQELDRAGRAELRRRHVALVGQRPGLVPFLSARENVELAEEIRGLTPGARERDLIASVGLAERSAQRVSRLSAGEQVRVAVARALAAEPELLLVDEPTARLDQANALTLAALLSRLARETQTAVVCATHDPLLIEQADARLALAPG